MPACRIMYGIWQDDDDEGGYTDRHVSPWYSHSHFITYICRRYLPAMKHMFMADDEHFEKPMVKKKRCSATAHAMFAHAINKIISKVKNSRAKKAHGFRIETINIKFK